MQTSACFAALLVLATLFAACSVQPCVRAIHKGVTLLDVLEAGPCYIDDWESALVSAMTLGPLLEHDSGVPVAALAAQLNVSKEEVSAAAAVLLHGGYRTARWAATAAAMTRTAARPAEVAADRLNYVHPPDWESKHELLRFVRWESFCRRQVGNAW